MTAIPVNTLESIVFMQTWTLQCKLVTGHTTVTIGVVYRCPNLTKQNNEKIHNAISEVSRGDCITMGDFNHGNIKWDSQQSTGVEDQRLLCLVQDNFLTQHVLEPTRAARVLDIVLSSQKEFADNVVIQEPLGSSDHNQLHFNTLSAKDGDLRLSASNACLPKMEISVFVTECVFFSSTCYKLHMFTLHDVVYS